jgi:hypothetical protein
MELAEQKLKEKAKEVCTWYNEKFHIIRRQEEKLAAATEKAAALDDKLVEREAQLIAKEKDLAAREEALAAKLKAKDDEIQVLLVQQMQDLEKAHKELIETQARDYAGKLKEATDSVAAAAIAKADSESKVNKLEEDLASSHKEIVALKDAA